MSQSKPEVIYFSRDDDLAKAMFQSWGWKVTRDLSDKEISGVFFGGGEDVCPMLYGELPHFTTSFNANRDMTEIRTYRRFMHPKFMKIGVCRGAQFLNVMNGGFLYQDVTNHTQSHFASDLFTGNTFLVTSTHHQQMIPNLLDGEVTLVSSEAFTKTRVDPHGKEFNLRYEAPKIKGGPINDYEDVEAVFYEGTNSFCFQPHPEYPREDNRTCHDYFKLSVKEMALRTRNAYFERIKLLKEGKK